MRVEATGLSTYPGVSVVCGSVQTAQDDGGALVNPVMLVEVLSDPTEAYDRGAKAAHYRRIPSLEIYLRRAAVRGLQNLRSSTVVRVEKTAYPTGGDSPIARKSRRA